MFSKALFKQSMKANWIKWTCVTVATCVMLAIVIIALGSLAIDNIRDSLKTVFAQADQESVLKESTIDGYELYNSTGTFEDSLETLKVTNIYGRNALETIWSLVKSSYDAALNEFQVNNEGAELNEENLEIVKINARDSLLELLNNMLPNLGQTIPGFQLNFSEEELSQFVYIMLCAYENNKTASDVETMATEIENAYVNYVYDMAYEMFLQQEDSTEDLAKASAEASKEMVKEAMGNYSKETYSEEYFKSLASVYVPETLIYEQVLRTFGVDDTSSDEERAEAEKYAVVSKILASTSISTYELWIEEYTKNAEKYPEVKDVKESAREQASASITDQLNDIDEEVAIALKELGDMDIYGLIIGNLFYRVAGILLPMVYVIMVANGLLAGQVDSGSMAYVLSTPTKRRTVTVTQMTYLMLSLLAMFLILTVVSVISIWIVGGNDFTINFAEILILNLGAFLTMFAFAGFCFMCSSIFNRTKYSLSIGGGISIFMLVCTILGLFGSDVVPLAMRIDQMNFFNYLSIISLFDATSILTGGISWLWKFGILALIGIVTFIVGVFCFEKKDLPL